MGRSPEPCWGVWRYQTSAEAQRGKASRELDSSSRATASSAIWTGPRRALRGRLHCGAISFADGETAGGGHRPPICSVHACTGEGLLGVMEEAGSGHVERAEEAMGPSIRPATRSPNRRNCANHHQEGLGVDGTVGGDGPVGGYLLSLWPGHRATSSWHGALLQHLSGTTGEHQPGRCSGGHR